MRSKKAKNLLISLSERDNIDLELLSTITTDFWNEVENLLSTSSKARINIPGLGVFVRKQHQVKKTRAKLQARMDFRKDSKYVLGEERRQALQEDIELLDKMDEACYEVLDYKFKKRRDRHEFIEGLGGKEGDMGSHTE